MRRRILTAKFLTIFLPAVFLLGCQNPDQGTDPASDSGSTSTEEMTEKVKETAKDVAAKTTTLAADLAEQAKMSAKKFPEKIRKVFNEGIETVRGSGIEKSAKQVGDQAIDADLTGWDGTNVKLSDLWSEGPIVLMWYRGGWCPYCNLQLRAMQESLDEIGDAGARLVVLTPELPEKAKETAEANELDIVALYDEDNQLASEYGIMFDLPEPIVPMYRDKIKLPEYNGNDKMQLPLSATYVVNKSGKITYAFLDADYKNRAEPADVIDAVRTAAE